MSKARHARTRRSTRRVVRTISIAGLGAGIAAAGAGAAFAADYTVKPGDTLSEIAQANGTNWRQLASQNNLENPDLILIGQSLKLDGAKKATVRQGERSVRHSEKRATKTESKQVRKSERNVRSSRSESSRAESKRSDSNRSESRRSTNRSESSKSSANSGSANMSSAWSKVASCESGGNPRAVNSAGYYGLFQFDRQTWRSVGGSGNPAAASAGEQLARAKTLFSQRGASPWPVCGRFLR